MQLQRGFASLLALLPFVIGQQVGTYETETHPSLSVQTCTSANSCQTQASSVVLDANWRWLHRVGQYTNCYTGNAWNSTVCTNGQTCATNCALEGAKYQETYGITTSGNKLTLKFVTNNSNGKNVGSRVYLMDPGSQTKYRKFNLLNNEFTFTTDVSQLPCGLNGALYFIAMDADGGMSKYSNNKAGAKYGTGYCDAQCPKDIKFIGNVANSEGWTAGNGPNVGRGNIGTCCPEMDIWEANSISTAYTPHPCTTTNNGPQSCTGTTCSVPGTDQGLCDQPGCDWNSYRLGDTEFYGPGKKVDTGKPITVVTQFITTTGTSSGDLKEIRRVYIQNGQVIANGKAGHPALTQFDSITSDFCTTQKAAFQDSDPFTAKGGMKGMGDAMKNGMVLALSLWHDDFARMLWLDSNYPLDRDANQPGTARGTCPTTSGVPEELEAQVPNSQVSFSDIRFGPIGSTYNSGGGTPTNPQDPTPTNPNPPSATQTKWGQCGGSSWSGPTACASGSTCTVVNQWYSQCL